MPENADQKNFEYGHISRSEYASLKFLLLSDNLNHKRIIKVFFHQKELNPGLFSQSVCKKIENFNSGNYFFHCIWEGRSGGGNDPLSFLFSIAIFREACFRWNFLKSWLFITVISVKTVKVQSCKLYNNKYMITSTQITNTEMFPFIAVLVFKLSSRKLLFINKKDNRNCQKVDYLLRK